MRCAYLSLFSLLLPLAACGAQDLALATDSGDVAINPNASPAAGGSPDGNDVGMVAAPGNGNGNDVGNNPNSVASSATSASLSLTGTGFATAENKRVFAVAFDKAGTKAASGNTTVQSGSFTLQLGASAAKLLGGRVAYYVDTNGNGFCNIAGTDAGGNVTISASAAGLQTSYDAKSAVPCDSFGDYALKMVGQDFTPHTGQNLWLAVMDSKDQTFVAGPIKQVVTAGKWGMSFPTTLLSGHAYQVRYFADVAKSGKCQDHSWTNTLPAVKADVTLTVDHDQKQAAICSAFPPLP